MGMEAWDAGVLGMADAGFAVAGSRVRAVPDSIAGKAASPAASSVRKICRKEIFCRVAA